ncbi:hypothetical protein CSA80_00035 [Candidatus Saccharibacteria bacterium]|nr:MAG: hypothetical protein CSA80_00035 [Candidatus Saccharibacteria bacterium]
MFLLAVFGVSLFHGQHATAAEFTTRQLLVDSNIAGENDVRYRLSFSGQTIANVGSIRLQLCSNDPFPGQPCVAPTGLDISAAQLVSQSGMTGFAIHSSTTANELVLTRVPSLAVAGTVEYELTDVDNPANPGTYFGRLEVFASDDASGSATDAAGLAVAYVADTISIQTFVPPYLAFCVANVIVGEDCSTATGSYIDFGDLSPDSTATDETKLLVATNADFGYSITVSGTTLTSGVNVIPAIASPDISRRGTSQFGLNLRANASTGSGQDPAGIGGGSPTPDYNQPNVFKYVSGDIIASYFDPDYYMKYTVNYIVNVSSDQPPGLYVSTLTYIALATF